MKTSQHILHSILLCLCISRVDAFWRMVCGTIQTGRVDPIVNPGAISGHAHTVAGPLNFNTTSTFASYQAAYCTSCSIQQDKSAYWTPQMYYRKRNGLYQYVPHDGTVVYYLGRGTNRSNIIPFPPGFRMLSGDNGVRAYDANTFTYHNQDRVANRVSFACLDISGPQPETPYLAQVNCSSGLRAQIHFQSCWDGVNLWKSDQSHVAYMSQIDNGDCPPGYPYVIPHLFYEIIYSVNSIDQSDGGMFVFSNGDVTGYAFHGDFQNGWNATVLTQAVASCINTNDGQITNCPPLAASVDPYFNINCPEQPPLVNETVKGLLTALPGCNPPTGGPARAAAAICPIVPTLNYVPNTDDFTRFIPKPGDIRAGWQYLGCSTDNSTIRPLTGSSYSNTTSMTIESCTAFCHANLYPLAGMEYGTQCYCGTTLSAKQPIQSPTTCALLSYYVCSGNNLEFCGAPSLLQVWQDTNYQGPPILPPPTPGNTTITLPTGTIATYVSCRTEASGARALTGYSFTNTTSMTVELCGAACLARSFLYFGLEFASQCYCGNTLSTAAIAETSCSSACAGNRVQFCGAGSILSVWSLPGAPAPASGTGSAATSTQSSAALTTVVPNSRYLGCYSETNPRALGTANGFSNASVTNTLCAAYAQQLNLQYFYTEYFSQCYAGNTLNSASVPIAGTSCNTPCTGNGQQTCGGSNALSLWNNTLYTPAAHVSPVNGSGSASAVQYAYQGCYTEGNGARALGGNAQYSGTTAPTSAIPAGTMTIEACAGFCAANGYPYMGVENGNECYCNGAGVINGAVVGTGCTTLCVGSPFELCGGASRIDVYKRVV